MEWLNLIGIVIVIVGFARKWNSILVILLAAGATGLVSGISPVALLETIEIGRASCRERVWQLV